MEVATRLLTWLWSTWTLKGSEERWFQTENQTSPSTPVYLHYTLITLGGVKWRGFVCLSNSGPHNENYDVGTVFCLSWRKTI